MYAASYFLFVFELLIYFELPSQQLSRFFSTLIEIRFESKHDMLSLLVVYMIEDVLQFTHLFQ